MTHPLNIAVIGVGVMGLRMLERLQGHDRLRPCVAWDADPQTLAHACTRFPSLRPARDLASALAASDLACAYIATPPDSHLAFADLAFDAGLAVLCEKPLSTDAPAARAAVRRVQDQNLRAAVNFPLATSPALAALGEVCRDQRAQGLGELRAVELELAFAAWPRPWQANAGAWLSEREQGGFTREVMSHFIFALHRLLGPAQVLQSQAEYPVDGRGAERRVVARLRLGAVDAVVEGAVTGSVADRNRLRLSGTDGDWELRDWSQLWRRAGGGEWTAVSTPPVADPYKEWVALIEGRAHRLATFAEAWAVQETIEALLAPVATD